MLTPAKLVSAAQEVTDADVSTMLFFAAALLEISEKDPVRTVGKLTTVIYDWPVTCEFAVRFQDSVHKEKYGETIWQYFLTDEGDKVVEFLKGMDTDE